MTRDLRHEAAGASHSGGLIYPEIDQATRIVVNGAGPWSCPRCPFSRTYATDQGALQGAAKHLLEAHRVRLMIEPRSHGGLYGGGR